MVRIVRVPASIQTVGWGVFCASSWTWCIGMFLPIVMLGRYGVPGFLAFAAPNVIGCAAFGYVVSRKSRSETLQRTHGRAMQAFSIITIAYHVFFIAFITMLIFGTDRETVAMAALLPVVMFALAIVMGTLQERAWPIFGVVAYGVSIVFFVSIGMEPLTELPARGKRPLAELSWLVPTLTFGFLLCPYLDLTFHRALRLSPSRHAFLVFGVTFAVMIVLTCAYYELLLARVMPLLVAHLFVQMLFTMAAHARELRVSQVPEVSVVPWSVMALPLVALPVAFAPFFAEGGTGTDMYVRFLVFYGLIFPAYVFLFMNPLKPLPIAGRSMVAAGIVVVLAMPLYELGFIHNHTWLLVPPLIALCVMRLVFHRRAAVLDVKSD